MKNITAWKEGVDWLDLGTDPEFREISWRVELRRLDPSNPDSDLSISDKYGNKNIILFHKDGSTTIHLPNWDRFNRVNHQIIQMHAQVRIDIKKSSAYIIEKDPKLTPSKIQSCRRCKGVGKVESLCWPKGCQLLAAKYDEHGDIVDAVCVVHEYSYVEDGRDILQYRSHYTHGVDCEHGSMLAHKVRRGATCAYCNGTGNKEYGSKPVMYLWNGSPIKFIDGKLLRSPRLPSVIEREVTDLVEHFGSV